MSSGFNTCMRIGEIFALTWEDINFENETIRVDKVASVKGSIKLPKTKSGIRDIEMVPKAKESLLKQFKITGRDNTRVFKTPTERNWIKTDWFAVYWRTALRSAGVKHRNPYQMRYTFISTMLSAGNSPMVLYLMMGHSNAQILYQSYARFIKKSG